MPEHLLVDDRRLVVAANAEPTIREKGKDPMKKYLMLLPLLLLGACFNNDSSPVAATDDAPQFPPNPPQNQGATLCPFATWNGDTLEVTMRVENWYGDADAVGWDMHYEGLTYIDTIPLDAVSDWYAFQGVTNTVPVTLCGGGPYPAYSNNRVGGFTVGDPVSPEGDAVDFCLVRFVEYSGYHGDNLLEIVCVWDDFENIEVGCSWEE